jgi:hypothetical protein
MIDTLITISIGLGFLLSMWLIADYLAKSRR